MMNMSEAWFVNAPKKSRSSAKARPKAGPHKEKTMAKKKRRKLAGAALAAHLKKVGRKSRKSRKSRKAAPVTAKRQTRRAAPKVVRAKRTHRKKHMVKRYHRKGGHVKGYNRHGANVKAHWSNPMGVPAALMEGLMTAGIVLGTLYVVGVANRQLERFGPTQSGWGNIAGKLGIALAAGYGAGWMARKGYLRAQNAHVVMGAAFLPLSLGLLNQFAPQVAGQISLASDEGMQAELEQEEVSADLEGRRNRLSDYAMAAELEAELEGETDSTF
jgi:hypothetical protein